MYTWHALRCSPPPALCAALPGGHAGRVTYRLGGTPRPTNTIYTLLPITSDKITGFYRIDRIFFDFKSCKS